MRDIDEALDQALTEEERALLGRNEPEPGFLKQVLAMGRGRLGWVMWVSYLSSGLTFSAGVYALWQMFISDETLAAVRWGIGALVLLQMTVLTKTYLGSHFEANRQLREIKRLKLRLVRLEGRARPGADVG